MLAAREGAGQQGGYMDQPLSSLQLPAYRYNELHLCGLKPAPVLGHFTSCSPSSRRQQIKSHKTGIFKKPPFKTQLQGQVFFSKSPTLKK